MRPSNRLRWRLTLLYCVVTLISGIVLLALASAVKVGVDAPAPRGTLAPPVRPEPPARATGLPVEHIRGDPDGRTLLVPGIALILMVPLSLGFGWYIAGRMLRPVRTMTGALQRISGRNVHERLALPGPRDEFKDLADTIDGLLGRLETAIDGHRRFVANAAHELRTPLTVEHALLEEPLIDREASIESYRANFEQLLAVNRHRAQLLESLLTLTATESARDGGELVDLDALVDAALRDRSADIARHDLTTEVALRPARLVGDPVLVARLVANLCDNAVHYNAPGGTIEVGTRTTDGRARLVVANTGPVVPVDQVERLFEPFQRLHRVADDGHHGLGLSIVRAIAIAHGAQLSAYARAGGGLSIEVLFPEPS
ncbi:HAMP domain-containing sensor histidine kinase [Dactylosporangium salmoneum]|uniref:histidine kinase n=1 Tax=Dactylosporangium salmoneum TaxID=53361 RepID=A0ABP5S986_9ACTN